MARQFVLVSLDTLELLLLADLNALQAMSVLRMKHVATRNAAILVRELVVSVQNVRL